MTTISTQTTKRFPIFKPAGDDYDILTWDLAPGDCYVFSGMTVHGAGGNRDQTLRRRGYTVRYTGEDVRYDPRVGTSKPLHDETLKTGDKLAGDLFPVLIES